MMTALTISTCEHVAIYCRRVNVENKAPAYRISQMNPLRFRIFAASGQNEVVHFLFDSLLTGCQCLHISMLRKRFLTQRSGGGG